MFQRLNKLFQSVLFELNLTVPYMVIKAALIRFCPLGGRRAPEQPDRLTPLMFYRVIKLTNECKHVSVNMQQPQSSVSLRQRHR